MSRLLGLDVGEKTIGTAVSDENGIMAFPRETIRRQEGWRRDMSALRALVAQNEICEIVVGLPLMLDGTSGIQVEKVEQFVAVLRRSVRVPIIMQDERLTTLEADRVLMQADLNRDERKRSVDSVAACLLLQAYLDSRKLEGGAGAVDTAAHLCSRKHQGTDCGPEAPSAGGIKSRYAVFPEVGD